MTDQPEQVEGHDILDESGRTAKRIPRPEQVEGESDQSRRRRYAGKIPPEQVEGEHRLTVYCDKDGRDWVDYESWQRLRARIEALTARVRRQDEYIRKLEKRQISEGSHGRVNYGGRWYVPEGYPEDE